MTWFRRTRPAGDDPPFHLPVLTAEDTGEPVTRGDINMVLQGLAVMWPKLLHLARGFRFQGIALRVGGIALAVALLAIALDLHGGFGQLAACQSSNRVRVGIVRFLDYSAAAGNAQALSQHLTPTQLAERKAAIETFRLEEAKDFPLRHCSLWAVL